MRQCWQRKTRQKVGGKIHEKLNNSVESRRQRTRTELQKGCEKHSEITPHQQKMKK